MHFARGTHGSGNRFRMGGAVAGVLLLYFGAVLTAVALAVPDLSWLAWFSLVPFFWAIKTSRPGCAAIAGALWGLCFYAVGSFSGVIEAGLYWLGLLVVLPAAYAGGAALLTRKVGFNVVALAVGWALVESAASPLGLRSGLLAGTQAAHPAVQWIANALGYLLVAALVAGANASLLALVLRWCRFQIPRCGCPLPMTAAPCGFRRFAGTRAVQRFGCSPRQARAPPIAGYP